MRRLAEPTVFVHFIRSWHLLISEQEKRKQTVVRVTSSTPYLTIALADGTRKRVPLEHLEYEYTLLYPFEVPLDVQPQSMTVIFPDLLVNGELLRLGSVEFVRRKATRFPC